MQWEHCSQVRALPLMAHELATEWTISSSEVRSPSTNFLFYRSNLEIFMTNMCNIIDNQLYITTRTLHSSHSGNSCDTSCTGSRINCRGGRAGKVALSLCDCVVGLSFSFLLPSSISSNFHPSGSEPFPCDAAVAVELHCQPVATAHDFGWDGAATFLDQLGSRSVQHL